MRSFVVAALLNVETASAYCNWSMETYRSNDCTGSKTTDSVTSFWGGEDKKCKNTNLPNPKGAKLVSCSSTSIVYDTWSTSSDCVGSKDGTFTLNANKCTVS